MRLSNKNCRKAVEQELIFTAHNIFSEGVFRNGNMIYTVYSYGYHFPMFINKNGQWYENKDKYSVSTSRQQTQSRPQNVPFVYLSTDEMKAL